MENDNFLEKFAEKISQNASVKNVFGELIQVGEKIILPVAHVAFGFGGGYGQMGKKNTKTPYADLPQTSSDDKPNTDNEGAGGGGGMYAKAKGIYEITPTSTRFIPAYNLSQMVGSVAIGFLVSRWFFPRRSKVKKIEK